MDFQARMKLTDDQKRKVAIKSAEGRLIGIMTLQDPASDTSPLDELQRQINIDLKSPEARTLLAEYKKLFVSDATPKEVADFERARPRFN